jgi:hypothetical protein
MKIVSTATGTIANCFSPDYYRNQSRACLYATSRGWEVGCAEFRQRGQLQGKFIATFVAVKRACRQWSQVARTKLRPTCAESCASIMVLAG